MKVAFVVTCFPTISETFILNQIIGLIQRGCQVDIYAGVPQEIQKIHTDVERYKLIESTHYWSPMPSQYPQRFIDGGKLILRNLHKIPNTIIQSLNVFEYGLYAFSLRPLYSAVSLEGKKRSYDIIHCHFGLNGLLGVFLKKQGILQGRIITTFYGCDILEYPKKLGKDVYSPLFKTGDAFWAISDQMKQELLNLGANPNRVSIQKLGIDCRNFTFKPRSLHKNNKVGLISIARLVEKKGIEYGIRAISKLPEEIQSLIEYIIVGDGVLKIKLQQLINELNLSRTIKILGWKKQSEVAELLDESDILIAPSVTSKNGDQEGTPVVIMEAMAMGLPVISTWHSGIPEVVQNQESGFLVPERDIDKLTAKISHLVTHPEVWNQMGSRGRDFIEKNHDINKLNDNQLSKYQSLTIHNSSC